ncbi:uncharacterized protein LOC144764019 [Lissotriton helveticus]
MKVTDLPPYCSHPLLPSPDHPIESVNQTQTNGLSGDGPLSASHTSEGRRYQHSRAVGWRLLEHHYRFSQPSDSLLTLWFSQPSDSLLTLCWNYCGSWHQI